MHIAHLLLTKRFAGTERHVLELSAAQAAAGHRVTLILRRKAAQARADAIAHRVDPRVDVLLAHDLVDRWPVIAHARALVRRLRPDIAHAHLGSASRALRGVRGIPRLATLHIDYVPEQHAHLDGLVAIAPWQLPGIPAPLRARSVQIDNWVLPRTAAPDARARIRAAIGVGDDDYLFGALGRMESSKGMDVLLEAFARAAVPGARLALVGGGRELVALRGRAAGQVALPGFVEAPEDWLAAFDCFVSPSREEPFGLVMIEAMQARLPVIATDTGGARHLATLIGTPLVATGDVDALAQALTKAGRERPARRDYPLDAMRVEHKLRELDAFYRRFTSG
ncbi:glycosyltransferase family 4 protein [Luteimonas kalidii]|uniref:Glycosyltransferase family 4 protein n=1 Tax=Luteimonas kalidii TaxID=3042025 RepID=A0ABT6JUU7_9GAMM|nr:glycosyltransferase family 4 protein [Luteimonas kalidii]MDH5834253.1 glycosyltransferase family 4 protein [Luteimonas kalidii]